MLNLEIQPRISTFFYKKPLFFQDYESNSKSKQKLEKVWIYYKAFFILLKNPSIYLFPKILKTFSNRNEYHGVF